MNFRERLKKLESSRDFFKWMWKLDGCPKSKIHTKGVVASISENGLNGFCEDVALFFWLSYEDVEIIQTDCHFCIKYKDKYYDSFNREGVSQIRDLEFFKRNPDLNSDIRAYQWKDELPPFYYEAAKGLLPLSDRIRNC